MRITTRILSTLALLLSLNVAAQLPAGQAPTPDPAAPMYRQTGEQYRVYEFPGTGEPIPYRLYVPENWAPGQSLPVLVTLRAGNSINNSFRAPNSLVSEARERGWIVVAPLGYRGYPQPYYNSRYPADRAGGPSTPGEGWTEEEDLRAELDVIHVVGLVTEEYGADASRIFVHGQNPSGSGAFHLAAEYPELFRGLVVSAGAIVSDDYPFERLSGKSAMLLLGDRDNQYTVETMEALTGELREHGVEAEYHTVPEGEHLTAYLSYAEEIFDFLERY